MNEKRDPELSIILPVFNEEAGIATLVTRLRELLLKLDAAAAEVIFVDDHSSDRSSELLRDECAQDPRFRFLRLSRNSGSHVAILAGMEHSRGRCVVFLASDLQDPPELIPRMMEHWRGGSKVVWAVRSKREGLPLADRVFSGVFYFLLNRFGEVTIPPQGSDFALLDRQVVLALSKSVGAHPSLGGEIAKLGFRQTEVSYIKEARKFGRSKWDLGRKLKAFADAFVSFSYAPLRAMSYLGLGCSFLGFLYAFFIGVKRLTTNRPVQGYASLMVAVLVIGGVQMIMLGVLGEYLWRTLDESRRRPRYFIEDSCGLSKGASETLDFNALEELNSRET